MKARWTSLVLLLALAGCGSSPGTVTMPKAPVKAPDIEAPPSLAPTQLMMIVGQERLKVGDSAEDADRAFPSPPGAFSVKELPERFGGLYRARGWETPTGGFGAIYYDNRLASAVWHIENITQGEMQGTVQDHVNAYGEPDQSLPGKGVQYWFWLKEDQRLMICSVPDRDHANRFDLTVALGHQVVMDGLRMSYLSAREDQSIADKRAGGTEKKP